MAAVVLPGGPPLRACAAVRCLAGSPPAPVAGRVRGGARGGGSVGGERARRAGRAGLGRDARVPAPPVAPRAGRGRGDGHRAARDGPGLPGGARAGPAQRRRGRVRSAAGSWPGSRPTSCRRARRRWPRCSTRTGSSSPTCVSAGAVPVLMCSRHLAAAARGPEDYLSVYSALLSEVDGPVLLHWLGAMFDPALAGYWGSASVPDAARDRAGAAEGPRVHGGRHQDVAAGRGLRGRVPPPAAGRGAHVHRRRLQLPVADRGRRARATRTRCSGVFAAIAPVAGRGAGRAGRRATWPASGRCWTRPCRWPGTCSARRRSTTRRGSCSWPGSPGHQDHFTMVGGLQSGRSPVHLAELLVLADEAGLLPDADLAAARARAFFADVRGGPVSLERFSFNQATAKYWPLPEVVAGCAAAGVRSVGLWREPVAEYGLARSAALVRDAGLAGELAVPRRFLRRGRLARRQPAGHRRGRRRSARRSLVLVCGGLAGRPLDEARGPGRGRDRGAGARTRWTPACGWRSSRCTRCSPPTAAWWRPSAARWRWPRRSRPRRSGSRWTRTTCGGTSGCCALIAARPASGSRASSWPTGCCRCRRTCWSGAACRGRAAWSSAGSCARSTTAGYTGPIEVEVFNAELWARPGEDVLRDTIAAYRAVPGADPLPRGGVLR